jgi:hypothetical protein
MTYCMKWANVDCKMPSSFALFLQRVFGVVSTMFNYNVHFLQLTAPGTLSTCPIIKHCARTKPYKLKTSKCFESSSLFYYCMFSSCWCRLGPSQRLGGGKGGGSSSEWCGCIFILTVRHERSYITGPSFCLPATGLRDHLPCGGMFL